MSTFFLLLFSFSTIVKHYTTANLKCSLIHSANQRNNNDNNNNNNNINENNCNKDNEVIVISDDETSQEAVVEYPYPWEGVGFTKTERYSRVILL